MAGTLFQDNLSPYLTIVEQGSTPATPGAGDQKLFIRTSDHLLCYVNSSGTVAPVSAGGSGSITSSGYTQNTARLLGRTTASAGAIEEITVGTGLSLSAGSLTATGAAGGASASYKRTSGDYTTTSSTFVDVDGTNLALAITTGAHRVLIGVVGSLNTSTAYQIVTFDLTVDGTRVGSTNGGIFQTRREGADGGTNMMRSASFTFLTDALTAASHTFKLQWKVDTGTATLMGGTSNNPYMQMYVIEQAS